MNDVDKTVDFLSDSLDALGLNNVGIESISAMKLGDIDEDFLNLLSIDDSTPGTLSELESKLRHLFKSPEQVSVWETLRAKEISPSLFEVLCYILLTKQTELFPYGARIYTLLLGMEPSSTIWNPILFNHILSILISAQQILANGAQLNNSTKLQLDLANDIFPMISQFFNESFSKMLGQEVLIALIEISAKLMTGFRVEFDKYNNQFLSSAITLLKKLPKNQIDYLLPFLVDILLLQFALNTNTLNLRLERIRDKLLEFCLGIFLPNDERLELLCKHLLLRAPERSHLRRSACYIIFRLSIHYSETRNIIDFIIKMSKSNKIGNRSVSLYMFQLYIMNIDEVSQKIGEDTAEIIMEISGSIKTLLTDISPTVRSICLDCLSQLIPMFNTNQYGGVIKHIIDHNNSLFDILKKRIEEEKLTVRKSALNCLNSIIQNSLNEIPIGVIELLTDRVRDRAISIRQSAIKILSTSIGKFPKDNNLIKAWLSTVLPCVMDSEKTVQTEAITSIQKNIFDPIIEGRKEYFIENMNEEHFEIMKNVFIVIKQKAIPLNNITNSLIKIVTTQDEDEDNIKIWKLLEILSSVESSHIKPNILIQMWDQRNILPPEYYSILGNIKFKDENIKEDSINMIHEVIDSYHNQYKLINGLIKIIKSQLKERETEIWRSLLQICCERINILAQSQDTKSNDLNSLNNIIFLLGEIISNISKSILMDYDFNGLQLLITNKLPNNTIIPQNIRAISTITLGKLCISRKDISISFVSAFVHQLVISNDPKVKCNCLIVLCDLCVKYSSLVDPHVQLMTNSFADESPIVQHQTLHVITRLVVEDFLKLKPLLFFKYVYAITDVHNEVALFAQSCLSVILEKFPKIISDSFIDTIYYFSGCIDLPLLGETNEEKRIFKINSTKRRQLALSLLISKLNEVSTYTLIQALFTQVLERYVKEELDVFKHGVVLEDVIHSLNELEDKMKQSTEVEVINDDPVSDSVFEASKRIMIDIHNKIIQTMLPTLNELHRLLRNLHSPCQKKLKEFYQKICLKHPNLLSQLEKSEPILAVELKNEMESIEEEEVDQQKTPPTTPKKDMPYTSPLLSKIATTPRSLLSSPKSQKIALLATPPRSKRQMEFSTPKHANDLD